MINKKINKTGLVVFIIILLIIISIFIFATKTNNTSKQSLIDETNIETLTQESSQPNYQQEHDKLQKIYLEAFSHITTTIGSFNNRKKGFAPNELRDYIIKNDSSIDKIQNQFNLTIKYNILDVETNFNKCKIKLLDTLYELDDALEYNNKFNDNQNNEDLQYSTYKINNIEDTLINNIAICTIGLSNITGEERLKNYQNSLRTKK